MQNFPFVCEKWFHQQFINSNSVTFHEDRHLPQNIHHSAQRNWIQNAFQCFEADSQYATKSDVSSRHTTLMPPPIVRQLLISLWTVRFVLFGCFECLHYSLEPRHAFAFGASIDVDACSTTITYEMFDTMTPLSSLREHSKRKPMRMRVWTQIHHPSQNMRVLVFRPQATPKWQNVKTETRKTMKFGFRTDSRLLLFFASANVVRLNFEFCVYLHHQYRRR